MHTEKTQSRLNNHICQHRGMKTGTVDSSFYYVFNISLYCNDTIPSFMGNLWRVLLLGNHLKTIPARLCFLCMDNSYRINEVSSMHYDSVHCNIIYRPCQVSVCSPNIGADFCSWSDALRDWTNFSAGLNSAVTITTTQASLTLLPRLY